MYKIIDGKKIAEKIKDEIAIKIYKLKGPRPNLAIILVGEREDSKLYVSLKEKEAKKVGIDIHTYKLDDDINESELLDLIDFLNQDELIDGILVQLPLAKKFNTDKVISKIKKEKDVDGFRKDHPDYIISPVVASILKCLESISFKKNQKVCILNNSKIFGDEIKKALKVYDLKFLNRKDLNKADLVISALGKPHFLKKEMIKKDAVVIDIGITKIGNKVLGDADNISLLNHISYLTPVPKGIGPITIAYLFKNVLEIYLRKNKL